MIVVLIHTKNYSRSLGEKRRFTSRENPIISILHTVPYLAIASVSLSIDTFSNAVIMAIVPLFSN